MWEGLATYNLNKKEYAELKIKQKIGAWTAI